MSLLLVLATAGAMATPPYKATGQEPGWVLTVDPASRRATLETDYGTRKHVARMRPQVALAGGERRWVSTDRRMRVTLTSGGCADSMSGKRFADTVIVSWRGTTYRGCGGDPIDGIDTAEWRVEDIGGRGLAEGSRATITVADGRIAGQASCNRFSAAVTIDGDRLTIGPIAATRMACPPALMEQERQFLDILGKGARWVVDGEGMLVVTDTNGRTIRARRAS